jgi:hypothetical protein
MDKNNELISNKDDLEKKNEDKYDKKDTNNNINQKDNDYKRSIDKKPKGYVRIFRKLIKNKNVLLISIMRKKFKIWKDEALKDFIFKKRITVRISVSKSKEKDKKRLSSEEKIYHKPKLGINDQKYEKINTLLNSSTSTSSFKKSKNKPPIKVNLINNMNWVKNNNSQFLSPMQKKEPKKFFYTKVPTNSGHKQNSIKEKANLTYIKKEKEKDMPITLSNLNSPYNPPNAQKKKLFSSKSSTGYKTIINNGQKVSNTAKMQYLNKSNNDKNNLKEKLEHKYRKIKVNLNVNMNNKIRNAQNNLERKNVGNLSHKNILTPNKSAKNMNIISDKGVLQKTNTSLKPYNTKKYVPLSKNLSAKKIKENYTNYKKIYHNKNDLLLNSLKKNRDINKTNFNNNTFSREHRISSPAKPFDRNSLKKGITTVFQHYSWITEEFNNYNSNTAITLM